MRENTFPFNIKQNVMNSSFWSSSMAMVYAGLCHTFNYPHFLSADINTDSFLFYLDPSTSYRIIIHDPKFGDDPALRGGGGLRLPGVPEDKPGEEGGVSTCLESSHHPSLSDHGGAPPS